MSSGDKGSAGDSIQSGQCVPVLPLTSTRLGADPLVTSVGGTEFTPNYDANGNDVGFTTEFVWNDSWLSAAARLVEASQDFTKPTYQNGVTPADGQRDVPDVAMIASPNDPGF